MVRDGWRTLAATAVILRADDGDRRRWRPGARTAATTAGHSTSVRSATEAGRTASPTVWAIDRAVERGSIRSVGVSAAVVPPWFFWALRSVVLDLCDVAGRPPPDAAPAVGCNWWGGTSSYSYVRRRRVQL